MSEKRIRNTDAVITLPLIDYNTGEYYSGTWEALTNAAVTVYHWSDNTAAAELTIAGVPTQIGSTGLWQLAFTANELNISSQYVVIKIDADELAAQGAVIELVDSFIETTASQIKSKTDLIPASPANESTLSTGITNIRDDISNISTADNSEVLAEISSLASSIASLNDIAATDILSSDAFLDLLTVCIGNHSIADNVYTFTRNGRTISYTVTSTTKVQN